MFAHVCVHVCACGLAYMQNPCPVLDGGAAFQVVVTSSESCLLTPYLELVTSMMFPFHWMHVFIPVLPQGLSEFLEAPVPFLVGVHSSMLKNMSIPEDVCHSPLSTARIVPIPRPSCTHISRLLLQVVLVDLDANVVKVPPSIQLPPLPEPRKKLAQQLNKIVTSNSRKFVFSSYFHAIVSRPVETSY